MGKLVVLLISVLTIFTSPCGESPNGITVSPSPSPTSAAIEATAEPQEEQTEEYDEGYGGFLELPHREEAAPSDNGENENVQTFTFSVDCHNALLSDQLKDGLRAVLPADGFIAPAAEYELTEGATVYDALMTAAEKYGFEVKCTSDYVSAIGDLGEFDCGPFSGWMYLINGEAILMPMDSYVINDGDIVRIAYTCSFGDDLGNEVE